MPTILPTDTAHLRPATKQYEILGRRLGSGIERRKLAVTAVFTAPWWLLLAVIGINPLTVPAPWIVVPVLFCVLATRPDASGRMAVMTVYDRLLARRSRRRRVLRNPAVATAAARREPVRITAITDISSDGRTP